MAACSRLSSTQYSSLTSILDMRLEAVELTVSQLCYPSSPPAKCQIAIAG